MKYSAEDYRKAIGAILDGMKANMLKILELHPYLTLQDDEGSLLLDGHRQVIQSIQLREVHAIVWYGVYEEEHFVELDEVDDVQLLINIYDAMLKEIEL